MCKDHRRLLVAILLAPLLSLPLHADPVERVLDYYRDECAAMIGDERDIDADLDKIISDPLNITNDLIYEIPLSPSGFTATVVYANFGCEGYGTPWCGSGGCGSMIIVGEHIYGPLFGGPPTSVSVPTAYGENQRVVLIPLGGSRCRNANDQSGINANPCYMSAVWDDSDQTFYSSGIPVKLWD